MKKVHFSENVFLVELNNFYRVLNIVVELFLPLRYLQLI